LAHENVMSLRRVSPHSATMRPPRRISPLTPPRGRTSPITAL